MRDTTPDRKLQEEARSLIDRDFFPGLNELRAIAVLCVIPGHVEQLKSRFDLPFSYWFPVPGKLGVVLFFVLSGFLITALLLREKEKRGTVGLKDFYARRILRIWPLYFLMLYLSLVVLNRWDFVQFPGTAEYLSLILSTQTMVLLLLVLPNFAPAIPYAGHLWSIGVEEQFYAVQPLVIKFCRRARTLLIFMIGVLFLNEAFAAFMPVFNRLGAGAIATLIQSQTTYFGCIAIGCIGAVLCHAKPGLVRTLIHGRFVQVAAILAWLSFLVAIELSGNEAVIDFRWHAAVFSIIIINAATNDRSRLRLRSPLLDYLGRISYGMYIYHVACIGISIALIDRLVDASIGRVAFDGLVYALSLGLTVLAATGSYFFFERYFLNLKKKFAASHEARSANLAAAARD